MIQSGAVCQPKEKPGKIFSVHVLKSPLSEISISLCLFFPWHLPATYFISPPNRYNPPRFQMLPLLFLLSTVFALADGNVQCYVGQKLFSYEANNVSWPTVSKIGSGGGYKWTGGREPCEYRFRRSVPNSCPMPVPSNVNGRSPAANTSPREPSRVGGPLSPACWSMPTPWWSSAVLLCPLGWRQVPVPSPPIKMIIDASGREKCVWRDMESLPIVGPSLRTNPVLAPNHYIR